MHPLGRTISFFTHTLCLFSIGFINPCASLYAKNGPVTRLTPNNFEDLVTKSSVVSVVEFYSPKCTQCQALANAYQRVAGNLEGIVLVGAVDCDDRRNHQLCAKYEVQGIPTIKVFPVDQPKNLETGAISKIPEDYDGPRNAKGISEFATSRIPTHFVQKLETYEQFQDFVNGSSKIRVVLISDKQNSTVLYQSLSARYHLDIRFAQAHSSLTDAVSELAVKEFPKLFVFEEGKNFKVYEDALKAPSLVAYFNELLESKQNATAATDEKWMELGTLEPKQLDNIVKTEDMWLIAFMGASAIEEADNTSDCKDEIAAFTSSVKNVRHMVNVAFVKPSMEDAALVEKFGVAMNKLTDAPCQLQIVRIPFGENKDEIDEYEVFHGETDAKLIQEFVIEAMPNLASEVDAQSVDPFLGGMGTPGSNPLMPKILLFTSKADCPQVYKGLAFHFRKWQLAFAFLPEPSVSTLERFGIKKLPLMVGIHLDPNANLEEVDRTSPQVPVRIQAYPGPPKFQQMAAWLTMFGSMMGAQPSDDEKSSSAFDATSVIEVDVDDELQSHCKKVGICVVGMLDRSSASFSADLNMLQNLAIKRSSDPLGFFWVDSADRTLFLDGLSVLKSDLPTLVAVSEHKMRYAVLREDMSLSNADHFLNGIMSGRERTAILQAFPSMSKTENMKSGETDEITGEIDAEEEMDLSEVMSEEIMGDLETKEDLLKRVDDEIEAKMAMEQDDSKLPKKKKKKSKKSRAKKQQKDEL